MDLVCFFGGLYCTELDLQHQFRVSNKHLVSIDIEDFWYRTAIYQSISKNSGIEPAIYQPMSKNSGIELVSTTSVTYCSSTGNCVLYGY